MKAVIRGLSIEEHSILKRRGEKARGGRDGMEDKRIRENYGMYSRKNSGS